ncbi:hypothetical protein OGAPHI_004032 [Ogataea philodendri]|uniref:Actin interacting protein 1 n=2 Tax=Saccharomycotina TaxID=147537 RepID=A0A9P8P6G6_9ASCO|nr:uncharacterized protein OGAPHI_004032 [Ogataea philodendri]KAH3665844.1 hypothetical protein OGAPHI_004032 [Ogataea philodendri]
MSFEKTGLIAANPATARATAVHLSYDAKSDRIAYASGKNVYIRSVSKPEQSIQFGGHNYTTSVAKFSPSGFYVASGDESGNVKVWDCVGEDLIVKGDYQIISGRINDIAWDADSSRVIAVGDGRDRYGHCFTADSGNSVGEISGHTAPVNAVAIRPCRPYRAVTVSDDAGLVFLQGPPFKFAQSVRGHHTNFVRDVKFSKDGAHAISVGADRAIVVYDGKTGDFIRKLDGVHSAGIFSIDWIDNESFITSSADASIKLTNLEGETSKVWQLDPILENQIVGCVKTTDYVIGLTLSGDLYYFSDSSDAPVNVVYGHQKSITAVSKPANGVIYTGSYDGRIIEWGLDSKPNSLATGSPHTNLVVGIEKSAKAYITAGWDDAIKKLDGHELSPAASVSKQPIQISARADLSVVITEDELVLLDGEGKLLKQHPLDFVPSSVAVSETNIVLADSTSFALNVYDKQFKSVGSLPPLRGKPSALQISPNGKYLAAGDVNGKIHCYNLEDLSLVTTRWAFHTSRISSLAWNADNDHVVSGSLDTNVIVYSVSKPARNIKIPNAHKEGVAGVSWLGDTELASGGADASIKFWKVVFA